MSSKTKIQAEVMQEIAYAAFSTHFRTVFAKQITDKNAHEAAQEHWERNAPHCATLWLGLVKGVVENTAQAQRANLLPPLLAATSEMPPRPLPGLGAPLDTGPAALARRLAGEMRTREGRQVGPAHDTPPGLAVGRATGDDPFADDWIDERDE